MHLLTAGDSWTFGSEIKDLTNDTVSDWDGENNAYPSEYGHKVSKTFRCR